MARRNGSSGVSVLYLAKDDALERAYTTCRDDTADCLHRADFGFTLTHRNHPNSTSREFTSIRDLVGVRVALDSEETLRRVVQVCNLGSAPAEASCDARRQVMAHEVRDRVGFPEDQD